MIWNMDSLHSTFLMEELDRLGIQVTERGALQFQILLTCNLTNT